MTTTTLASFITPNTKTRGLLLVLRLDELRIGLEIRAINAESNTTVPNTDTGQLFNTRVSNVQPLRNANVILRDVERSFKNKDALARRRQETRSALAHP